MEKKLNDLIDKALSRRKFMAGAGTTAAAALIVGCNNSSPAPTTTPAPTVTPTPTPTSTPTPTTAPIGDADILTFALNLEYLEAEFYLNAATGTGLSSTDAGGGPNPLIPSTGTKVNFADAYLQQYANEVAQDELNHVRYLRAALAAAGAMVQPRPMIDLTFFAGLGTAAGITNPTPFNPFADENQFLVGAFVFEDVGVTAYLGAAGLISSKAYLGAAAGILGTEAYHAAEIRTVIAGNAAASGATSAQTAALANANAISALRGKISMASGNMNAAETTLSTSMIVNADSNALAFPRTTDQVLHIVYGGASGAGVAKGGFFPNGLNGKITTTTT